MKKIVTFIATLLLTLNFSIPLFADNLDPVPAEKKTIIKGQVADKTTGESLAGVLVQVKGSNIKTYTDLDGNFVLDNLDPGTYTIEISYISYDNNTLNNIEFEAGSTQTLKISIHTK